MLIIVNILLNDVDRGV